MRPFATRRCTTRADIGHACRLWWPRGRACAVGLFRPNQDIDYERIFSCPTWVAWAGAIMWYVLAIAAIIGAVVLRRRRGPPLLPLVAIPGIVFLAMGATFSQARYRAPAEIAVTILAAVAVDEWLRHRRNEPASGARSPVASEAHGPQASSAVSSSA